jgi:hypothetical protein
MTVKVKRSRVVTGFLGFLLLVRRARESAERVSPHPKKADLHLVPAYVLCWRPNFSIRSGEPCGGELAVVAKGQGRQAA